MIFVTVVNKSVHDTMSSEETLLQELINNFERLWSIISQIHINVLPVSKLNWVYIGSVSQSVDLSKIFEAKYILSVIFGMNVSSHK